MPDDEHFRRLERLYLDAPVSRVHRSSIRVSEGVTEVEMEVRPDFFHAAHALHGSVLFKMLDDAAFFAANSLVPDVLVLTASFTVHFTRPVSSGRIRAVGSVVDRSRRRLLADARVEDDDGRLLATGTGSFMPSEIALGPKVGYV